MLLCGVTNTRSKGPGVYLIGCACVHLCVCACVHAVRDQSALTCLHEDESLSWSAKTKTPPTTHTHIILIHANGLICKCVPYSINSHKNTWIRVTVSEGGSRWERSGQIGTNSNFHCVNTNDFCAQLCQIRFKQTFSRHLNTEDVFLTFLITSASVRYIDFEEKSRSQK